jgi:molecular chaperone IbpA
MTTFPSIMDFHKFDPFAVGFTDVFKDLQEMSKTVQKAVSYPPYNIRQIKENKFVIEMAVAGFAKSDIEVTLEGNKLIVKGLSQDTESPESFIYKGIANRNFTREFKLNDKIEIENAEMANGMLRIWLENIVKAQDAIKKIAVKEKADK